MDSCNWEISSPKALCLLEPTFLNLCVCVLRVGLYSVLMGTDTLGFWFIPSKGTELVTLIRHSVKIKPHSWQDFCLVVQQIFFLCTMAFVWCCWPSATKLAPRIWFPISPANHSQLKPIPMRSWSKGGK